MSNTFVNLVKINKNEIEHLKQELELKDKKISEFDSKTRDFADLILKKENEIDRKNQKILELESQIKSSFTQMQTNENSTISNFEIVDLNDKKLIEVLELKNQEE